MRVGQMSQSKAEFRQGPDAPAIPLIVEILAQTAEIAHDKILKLALSRRHEIQPLMVIIGLNSCVDDLGSRASNLKMWRRQPIGISHPIGMASSSRIKPI